MADNLIPDDIREFILRHLDSVTQLEALLLLRSGPGEDWDVARTTKRLYTSERDVADALARLAEDGFLTIQNGVYRYRVDNADQTRMVDRLASIYSTHLIPVTKIIHAKPRRIREFADAFKLRKDR